MATQQPSVNIQSVQVTYRVFLRDMFPGWIFSLWLTHLIAPNLFATDTLIIFVAFTAFIWSPIIGLLINILGYVLLERLLENQVSNRVFEVVFHKESNAIKNYIANLASIIGIESEEGIKKFQEELFDRLGFIIRTSGWSDKDEVVERVRGVYQTVRTLSFILILFSVIDGTRPITIYSSHPFSLECWQIFLPVALVFVFLAWFLNGYIRVTELRLLYELILLKQLPLSILQPVGQASSTV